MYHKFGLGAEFERQKEILSKSNDDLLLLPCERSGLEDPGELPEEEHPSEYISLVFRLE